MGEPDSDLEEVRKVAGSLSPRLPWELANPKWAASLNPILANPMNTGRLIQNIVVLTGDNVINHGLGQKLQGYIVVMNNSNVTFYDRQSDNQRPELTLILVASGDSSISLYVF